MSGALFVISEQADRKLVNRVLIHLRRMTHVDGQDYDCFEVITSQDPLKRGRTPDTPPLQSFDNQWAGKSIADTERFMVQQFTLDEEWREGEMGKKESREGHLTLIPNPLYYLVLDDQGVQEKTVILMGRDEEYDEVSGVVTYLKTFKKARLPWADTSLQWVNLDIANVNYDEVFDDSKAAENDGWCVWVPNEPGDPEIAAIYDADEAAARERRDAAIVQLESAGDA